jgi:hypothetical protein
MTTLIAVYNSEGLVGRCDAHCHDATTPECRCVCGGMNHGAGQAKAIENTRAYVEQMVEDYAKRNGLTQYQAEVGAAVSQLALF